MIQIILIAILSLLSQILFPWWSLAIVAFIICYWRSNNSGQAFLYGFIGTAFTWIGYALLIHTRTDGIFTGRMGELLFKSNNIMIPLLITAVIGGLVGGMAGLSGFFVWRTVINQIEHRVS
ncbi:hypothetical protein [Spirosoma sp.]|uniref:hypothetical protein n=1 Tax=Spirosoma sp. TaxID=1899569 RepID=UPI003B3A5754